MGSGSRALPQGLPRIWRRTSREGRETAAEPTAHTSPSPPSEAPRISQGPLGGLRGRAILPGIVRASGEGTPPPGGSRPLLPPRTLAVPAPTSVTRPSGVGSEPPGVVLWTGACLVAKRLQTLGAAREPFRGLCPVGARRGRGGSQGRVVEGQDSWSGSPISSPGHLPDPRSNPDLLHCRHSLPSELPKQHGIPGQFGKAESFPHY